jgi:hypothetical protein
MESTRTTDAVRLSMESPIFSIRAKSSCCCVVSAPQESE